MVQASTRRAAEVRVIDVAPYLAGGPAGKARVADQVDAACRETGFLVITGHGVPERLIAEVDRVARDFFDLPRDEKMLVQRPAKDVTRGYIPIEGESVGRSRGADVPGDLNESFMIGPVDVPETAYFRGPAAGKHFHPNLWPERPAAMQPTLTEYFRTMGGLATELMRIFALALRLDEHFFDDKIDRHISRLRIRNYPAQETTPKPGQLRAGAHSDYGSLTILRTEDQPGGLQVADGEGGWLDVPILPGCLIVNLGDAMQRWTNDVWVSTLHRVVNPPRAQALSSRRQSLVFFHNPNYDAPIECLPSCRDEAGGAKYEPVTSGDYLRMKFVATQQTY
jgi:isopenicillin N synthase-like dioxygenase